MYILSILLLAIAAVNCQTETGQCESTEGENGINITCANIADFTLVARTLETLKKQVYKLKINKSPQLILKREDFEDPKLADVVILDLTRNNLTNFDSETIRGLTNLDTLLLGWNNFKAITADTFSGLGHLSELRLTFNQIITIDAAAFQHLKNLTLLDISDNYLTFIPDGLFDGLGFVKVLDLCCNRLGVIEEDAFTDLKKMEILILGENNITDIDYRAFRNLESLNYVELRILEIKALDSRLFERNRLTLLDLKGNNLENLHNFSLNITTLLGLRLSGSNITTIPVDYFRNVPNLLVLDLEDNLINSITPGVFTPLSNLTQLSLLNNSLASIDIASFEQIDSLLKSPPRHLNVSIITDVLPVIKEHNGSPIVTLSGNPWDCQLADMVQLRAWCDAHDVAFEDVFPCN